MKKICLRCGKEFEPSYTTPYQRYCSRKCCDKQRRYYASGGRKRNRQRKRIGAIKALGGKCAACGVEDVLILTIDHINGDWRNDPVHRKDKIGLYRWILNNAEEAKRRLQVLCWNHNALKAIYPEEFDHRFPWLRKCASPMTMKKTAVTAWVVAY